MEKFELGLPDTKKKTIRWDQIEFFINPKMEKDTVFLGKHQLRFKTKLVHDFGLQHGDKLKIGFSKDENPKVNIYLVKCLPGEQGFQFCESKNHTYSVAFKGLFKKLDIVEPTNARYTIEKSEFEYIKITIPRFLTNVSTDKKQ